MRYIIRTVEHSKFRRLLPPYQDFHSAGPFFRPEKIYGRMYINLLQRTETGIYGILYARYLLEVTLGRKLKPGFEVDHIDGCPWNDSISNLQELSSHENMIKGRSNILDQIQHAESYLLIKCPNCEEWFERKRSACNGKLIFCSRHCNGVYGQRANKPVDYVQEVQHIVPPDINELPKPYYEDFNKYSTPMMHTIKTKTCMCGSPVATPHSKYCIQCYQKVHNRKIDNPQDVRNELCDLILNEYKTAGNVVMSTICKKIGLSDRGLAKRIERLFGAPYKDVIKQICSQ